MKAAFSLTHLNTVWRRIDLLCKLIVRLAVSLNTSVVDLEKIAAAVAAATSLLSWGPEC